MQKRLLAFGGVAGLALGAASALLVLGQAGAAAVTSSVVPIAPCRLVDTRPGADHVGDRTGALASGETVTLGVIGTHGNCEIPSGATAIVANVTIVQPTDSSFLTIYPADVAQPLTSNLNWVPGQAPTANQASVALSGAGAINVYNHAGSVDVIIDIISYLTPGGSGPAGVQGPPGVQGQPGEQGEQGAPGVLPPTLITGAREYTAGTGNVTYAGTGWQGCSAIALDVFGLGAGGSTVATNVTPNNGAFGGTFVIPTQPGSYVLLAQGSSGGPACQGFTMFRVVP